MRRNIKSKATMAISTLERVLEVLEVYQATDDDHEKKVTMKTLQTLLESSDNEDDDELEDTIVHVLDCLLGSDAKHATQRLLDVFVPSIPYQCYQPIVDRLETLRRQCSVESIRGWAVCALGLLQHTLCATYIRQEGATDLYDVLQQCMLLALTDKAVSVRSMALCSAYLDDTECRQTACWNLAHDPSVSNRTLAVQVLPLNLSTLPYLMDRLRDVKVDVRLAVLAKLQEPHDLPWSGDDRAQIVTTGWKHRCPETKQATQKLVCHWLRNDCRFDLMKLVHQLDVIAHTEACRVLLEVLYTTLEDPSFLGWSDHHLFALRKALQQSNFSVDELLEETTNYPVEQLLVAASCLKHNEDIRSHVIPDIAVLCQVLEHFCQQLVQELVEASNNEESTNHHTDDDKTDQLVCICSLLLELAESPEEGSRRVLQTVLKNLLQNILTPDDLIESAIKAYHKCSNEFVDNAMDILQILRENTVPELEHNYDLRVLTLLGLVMERAKLNPDQCETYIEYALERIESDQELVKEAAVSCLGKLGLFVEPDELGDKLQPALLQVATNTNEKMDIRLQAVLGLSDWSVLVSDPLNGTFESLISEFLTFNQSSDESTLSTCNIGAEVAAKLLYSSKSCDLQWTARLLYLYFLTSTTDELEEQDEAVELGSTGRLQQLLTVFFPSLARKHRATLMGSIEPLLGLLLDDSNTNKRQAVKIVDYVVSCVDGAFRPDKVSSATLSASVQVASFLSEHGSELNTTFLRTLCKFIGGIDLDVERELYDDLSLLKEIVEELHNVIDDGTSLKYLASTIQLLADVEMEEEVKEDDDTEEEDHEEEGDAVLESDEKEGASPNKDEENEASTPTGMSTPSLAIPKDTPTVPSSVRRSRRLRPSN